MKISPPDYKVCMPCRSCLDKGNGTDKGPTSSINSCLTSVSSSVIGFFEYVFYSYGVAIAKRPIVFILLSLVLCGACCIGLLNFKTESRGYKLWIPEDSDYIKIQEWQTEEFPSDSRVHLGLYEAENVLKKEVLLNMLDVHEKVANITVEGGKSWEDLCARLPVVGGPFGRRKKRSSSKFGDEFRERAKRQTDVVFDWSSLVSRDDYCDLQETLRTECIENSLLEVWGYDRDYLESLTPETIIRDLSQAETSSVTGLPANFTKYLGGITRNAEGKIIGARAATHTWIAEVDRTAIDNGESSDDPGTESKIDKTSSDWEKRLIVELGETSYRLDSSNFYYSVASSFGLISGETIQGDVQMLGLGFVIVFIYVVIMLGRFNLVEQRPILSLLGLSSVGLAIGVSYGLCSAFGILYGPVNSVLPFLLLGLGIDDMFVIMQTWNNLELEEEQVPLVERVGLTLKHAGVAITVTSVTDFTAFAIGSTTVLPALRSFCLYAAIGIAAIYFFQSTYFVAWLTYDQRRLESKRQGCFWCLKLDNWTPNECSKKDLLQNFFENYYARILLKLPTKILVILFTVALLGVTSWGVSNLRQDFDPIWFLPQRSYLYQFFTKQRSYYPSSGQEGIIYFGQVDLVREMPRIEELVSRLKESNSISEVSDWYSDFKSYWVDKGVSIPDPNMAKNDFQDRLSQFLFAPVGSKYRRRNFRFLGNLTCKDPAPPVRASSIGYKHILLVGSKPEIAAMSEVKRIIASMNFSGLVAPWARSYSEWETNEIIEEELYRNMGLALLVVFLMTLLLIASLSTSLMVLLCVVLTLVDVCALMNWWGLTIDTVSCIDLVLAIGLCVDYAVHVGHTFMTESGTRNQRARQTVAKIGPAVLNGGISTFLAFAPLAASDSHVFLTFFKIFFAVCMFGLYNGLVFLPVLLSFVGPAPYETSVISSKVSSTDTTPQKKSSDWNSAPGMEKMKTHSAGKNGHSNHNSARDLTIEDVTPGRDQTMNTTVSS
ncbi:patched domain-containing protein 3-like [Oratosquilla oratoria]|uniref:patched domain-containing protein 3-like n=1 Tax=Oratosquilla oratoria TaxID=337810 RepID=UPI003F75BE00